jgi:hypothetical protein
MEICGQHLKSVTWMILKKWHFNNRKFQKKLSWTSRSMMGRASRPLDGQTWCSRGRMGIWMSRSYREKRSWHSGLWLWATTETRDHQLKAPSKTSKPSWASPRWPPVHSMTLVGLLKEINCRKITFMIWEGIKMMILKIKTHLWSQKMMLTTWSWRGAGMTRSSSTPFKTMIESSTPREGPRSWRFRELHLLLAHMAIKKIKDSLQNKIGCNNLDPEMDLIMIYRQESFTRRWRSRGRLGAGEAVCKKGVKRSWIRTRKLRSTWVLSWSTFMSFSQISPSGSIFNHLSSRASDTSWT